MDLWQTLTWLFHVLLILPVSAFDDNNPNDVNNKDVNNPDLKKGDAKMPKYDHAVCRELGFSSALLCSTCEKLQLFGLSLLFQDCRLCCQEEDKMVSSGSFRAVLQLCFQ
ncbi:selenoprotein F-like [Branchiostoma floridae x Branchiostoma japonicum]